MDFFEIINKKKNKQSLTYDEYFYFVNSLINGEMPDYQAAALLMAIYINGMNDTELFDLTQVLIDTSEKINPVANNFLHITVDKHSSGGIGDKVSLILSPILAALGYDVVKLSGRGLSFTGGTIDKLEAIGICDAYDSKTFQINLDKTHIALMLQSENIVPGDKKLYALRDVTGTVDSFPLIAASIMSKKLIIQSDYIFLDIKVGDGAFFKTVREAEQFSELILKIAQKFNRKTIIHLTSMSQPLGRAIGNAIEVKEAVDFLQNKFHSSTLKDLIFQFCADILIDSKVCSSYDDAIKQIENVLINKQAYNAFVNFVNTFSNDPQKVIADKYFDPQYKLDIYAPKDGYAFFNEVSEIGLLANHLGAGRFKKEDILDYQAGIWLYFDPYQYVKQGDLIATLYANKPINNELSQKFLNNLVFNNEDISAPAMIIKKIK